MSCNSASLKARLACTRAGIGASAAQASNTVGTMAGRAAQLADAAANAAGGAVAPVSNRVLATVDRPASLAANVLPKVALALVSVGAVARVKTFHRVAGPTEGAMPGVLAGVGVAMRQPEEIVENLKRLGQTQRALKRMGLAAGAGRMVGSLAVDLAASGENRRALAQTRRTFLVGEQKLKVEFGGSRLTGLLNRGDRLVSSGNVVSSDGDMVSLGYQGWHRGTTVVKMPGGERTLTHLSSLAIPPSSVYFDRRLSDEEVAGVVSGQIKPHRLPGYAGGVNAAENLAPAWAQTKRAMILTRLHWPATEKPGPAWQTISPGEESANA